MSRTHVEFIQTQMLSWMPFQPTSSHAGCEFKLLSRDLNSGASSLLIRYPERYAQERPHFLDSDEELYVIDGGFCIGGQEYTAEDYAYLPAGYLRESMTSHRGATVLTFFESEFSATFKIPAKSLCDTDLLIMQIRSSEMKWQGIGETNVVGPDIGRKEFRFDPATKERTWILKVGETNPDKVTESKIETHPCVEEMYLLGGSISMTTGVLRQGAYFWRPPHIPHGPFGCRDGSIGFFRTKEGEFLTKWSSHSEPINWDAPYDPILPDDVATNITKKYDKSLPY